LWFWPLIPLLLGALALALAARGGEEQGARDTTNGGNAATGAAITDMLTIVNAQNPTSYVGQPATFANVQVQSVSGDRAFWVGPNPNQQLFVAIDDATAGRSENQIQVAPGQSVTLSGVIQKIPSAGQIPPDWGLNVGNGTAPNQQVYLQAQQVRATR
jgi:hypothetical protein